MSDRVSPGRSDAFDAARELRVPGPPAALKRVGRIANRTIAFGLIVWRTLFLAALARVEPDASPQAALAPREILLLDRLAVEPDDARAPRATLSIYVRKLALIGGDHAPRDGQARILAVWRGLSRLVDIQLAADMRAAKYRRC